MYELETWKTNKTIESAVADLTKSMHREVVTCVARRKRQRKDDQLWYIRRMGQILEQVKIIKTPLMNTNGVQGLEFKSRLNCA